ncbi:MFS transporter [Nonomuraea sp. NPDC050556]|uniref:MFS transporter n=1 Tax=Nonomuraea sp. NPDC050556 TaxID=3364369 RepID=UPI0037B04186
MAAFLVIGLPVGVWVDRLRRRPVLVVADAARALVLATVPLGDLARSMGVLESIRNLAALVGPGVGGWLVQLLTAPIAILVDAVTYALSSVLLSRVRAHETPNPERGSVMEGLRYVTGHPVLRLVAIAGATVMFTNGIWAIVQPLLLVRELGVSPAAYGLIVSATGAGGLVGAILAPRVVARVGNGMALYGSAVLLMVIPLITAGTGPGWRLVLYPVGMALFSLVTLVLVVAQGSYRQAICPEHLRGRMNASLRFLMWGALPVGGVLGGLVAEALTIQQMLWLACFGSAAANLPYVLNPFLRTVRITP